MTILGKARTVKASDKALLLRIKRLIRRYVPDAEVLLYGSKARGTATPESDYDILVLAPSRLSAVEEDAVYAAVYPFEVAKDVVVSIVFYSREEWDSPVVRSSPYHKAVVRDCVAV